MRTAEWLYQGGVELRMEIGIRQSVGQADRLSGSLGRLESQTDLSAQQLVTSSADTIRSVISVRMIAARVASPTYSGAVKGGRTGRSPRAAPAKRAAR